MSDLRKAADGEMNNNLVKQPIAPSNIVFTWDYGQTEVMRITREGVFVNPDIAVDDAAKAVLDAIDSQIKVLVQSAVEDEREACAKLCEELHLGSEDNTGLAADLILARSEK